MCRAKGSVGAGIDPRCEKCNEPTIRRDRQNLANRVKREMREIETESTDLLERPVTPEAVVSVSVNPEAAIAPEADVAATQTVPVDDATPEPEVISEKEATFAGALAETITDGDGDVSVEDAENVIAEMLAEPEVGKKYAEALREKRLNAEDNTAWILDGRENTPENLAIGLAERQQEIILMGGIIAERAQAIHGIDVDTERRLWVERLDEATETFKKDDAAHTRDFDAYIARRNELAIKYDSDPVNYRKYTTDEESSEISTLLAKQTASGRIQHVSKVKLNEMMFEGDSRSNEVAAKIAEANRQAINEVRDIGNVPVKFKSGIRSSKDMAGMFNDGVSGTFPDEWVANSNKQDNLVIKRATGAGRAHYIAARDPGNKFIYSMNQKPNGRDDRFSDWTERKDENGNPTGKWEGIKRDFLEERSHRNYKKYNDNDTPKGAGWVRGHAIARDGNRIPGWVRDNPQEVKRIASLGNSEAEITLDPKATHDKIRSTIQHEFSHRIEDTNPHIPMMEEAFLASRTTNKGGKRDRLMAYTGRDEAQFYATSGSKETVRPDNFVSVYMGKEYKDNPSREVLSMGTEAVFGGTQGGLVGIGKQRTDYSMRNWILGMYAVA